MECSGDAPGNLPFTKEYQRWDALDPILGGELWLLVDVDLDDGDPAFEFLRDLLDHRCKRLAWPAPLCPEVDKYR